MLDQNNKAVATSRVCLNYENRIKCNTQMSESKNNLHSAVGSLLSQLCGGRFSRSASGSYSSGFSYSALDSFSNLVFFWDVDVPTVCFRCKCFNSDSNTGYAMP